jgi:hypothetical protein
VELSRYVHLNPVRIKKHASLDIKEKQKIMKGYPWSSFRGYTHLRERLPFVEYGKILGMIGGGDEEVTRRHYGGFVLSGIAKDRNIRFWEGVRGQSVLGSDDFVNWVKGHFLSGKEVDKRELPGLKALEKEDEPHRMEAIAREVASGFSVKEEDLYLRFSPQREARSVFMEFCCLYLGRSMSFSQIGRRMGEVSVAALRNCESVLKI